MAKAIMIQGTMSNVGKSLLCAGLCRVFKQDGYRVAPFKSQNMALNSYITRDGLEMGRAQAVQAEACGLEPTVHMNPILLKPVSDQGSQVILMGQVLGTLSAREYFRRKKELIPQIMAAYHTLDAANDIIVLEGAGSPAEINLKQDDIVNMGMAQLAQAPVLLVGDIDRGGVFAQLYGTLALLEEAERRRVKATIINKFRGDRTLLAPGLTMLEELTKLPVAGVVPWLSVEIDDEDSLSPRLSQRKAGDGIDIAVIRLPRLSNFTDLAALEATDGVGVRYVGRAGDLGTPDLLILPGTKSTMADLDWLRRSGLEGEILAYAAQGNPLLGLCGGYQMLGETLEDPDGVEGGGSMAGLGLLPVETRFLPEKRRVRTRGKGLPVEGIWSDLAGVALEGYEIHMGRSERRPGDAPFLELEDGRLDGCVRGNVCGTYLHGFFDSKACRQALLAVLSRGKGLSPPPVFHWTDYKEQQYDKLAQGLRDSLDMDRVYRIVEEGM